MIVCGWGVVGVGYIAAACHELAGGRWLCGDRTNGRPGCAGSGANHCLLVSFPLLSELLSRTAPTGRKEGGVGVLQQQGEESQGSNRQLGSWWDFRKRKSRENEGI